MSDQTPPFIPPRDPLAVRAGHQWPRHRYRARQRRRRAIRSTTT